MTEEEGRRSVLREQVSTHVDERNERIRAAVTPIQNVGDETADAIARKFESVRELRQADRQDLTAIHGVGESTAEAMLERVRE